MGKSGSMQSCRVMIIMETIHIIESIVLNSMVDGVGEILK